MEGGELMNQPNTISNLFRETLKFEVNRLFETGVRKANIEIELLTYIKGCCTRKETKSNFHLIQINFKEVILLEHATLKTVTINMKPKDIVKSTIGVLKSMEIRCMLKTICETGYTRITIR
jgi:hypothetical protein